MEPSPDPLPTAIPTTAPVTVTPADPHIARISDDVAQIMDRAYLEAISRTKPDVFMKFATAVLGMRSPRAGDRQHTVVNVVNAIPRSPLDGLPPGFSIK